MTEEYLQYIWAKARLPHQSLYLSNGKQVIINDVGNHNKQLKGPDFSMGSVTIDGVRFFGPIEMHVKSSDWFLHKHDKDESYDNVILHVVYEEDTPVVQNGYQIPCLELKPYIDIQHFYKFKLEKSFEKEFVCDYKIHELPGVYLESMKAKALVKKLTRKQLIIEEAGLHDPSEILYHLLGLSFGGSVNKLGFESLVEKVPYRILKTVTSSSRERLLLSESGIIQAESFRRQRSVWNFKGVRPHSFPTVRVHQFTELCVKFDFDTSFVNMSADELIVYFQDLFARCFTSGRGISNAFQNHLLINAVVPFIWCFGGMKKSASIQQKALDVLELIDAEQNRFVTKWKTLGMEAQNAYDSQSLLAIYRYFCSGKKCLSCEIGNKVLNR